MKYKNLGTENGSHFLDKFYAPITKWPKVPKNFKRLPPRYSFNLEEMLNEYHKLIENFSLKPFPFTSSSGAQRERASYRGLGLSSRPGSQHPLYDGLGLFGEGGKPLNIYDAFARQSEKLNESDREVAILDESSFSELTQACSPYFQNILKKFSSPFSKVRFLELMPGGIIPPHFDFPYYQGIRVHAALKSNPDVIWEVDGEQFTIPVDGHFYWFDTGKYHAVKNFSKEPRVVLSVNLMVYTNREGKNLYDEKARLLDLIEQGLV